MAHIEIPLIVDNPVDDQKHHITLVHFPNLHERWLQTVCKVLRSITGCDEQARYIGHQVNLPTLICRLPEAHFGKTQFFGWRDKKLVRLVESEGIHEIQQELASRLKAHGVKYSSKHFNPHVTNPLPDWEELDPIKLAPVINLVKDKQIHSSYPLVTGAIEK